MHSGGIQQCGRQRRPTTLILLFGLAAFYCIYLPVFAQTAGDSTTAPGATTSAPASPPLPEDLFGLWTLAPALVAIITAILFRNVFPALILGILTGSAMMMFCLPAGETYGGDRSPITVIRLTVERYLVGALTDPSHTGTVDPSRIQTVLFTLTIAGMVGVIAANGGTAALVRDVGRMASTRIRGQTATSIAGLLIFFDDYSNCMIIGPTMRPILDRLRVSREKLSFLLDATAAPVASLAPFGTWIATELLFIQSGLDQLRGDGQMPAYLEGMTAYKAFLWSLPYRFYVIFALVLVFILCLSGRDFGPMLAAERRAARSSPTDESRLIAERPDARWWHAGVPILGLITASMVILFLTGWFASKSPRTVADILGSANAYVSIMYGAITAMVLAILISVSTRALSFNAALEAMMVGVQRILPAVIVLIFAWALSDCMKELHLGKVAVHELKSHQFSPHYLPMLVFVSACIVSFATGTSWGTMGILCPVAVLLAGNLTANLAPGEALPLFYATVGSVLAGAVFGDHCSPISDTTVLSALAAECPLGAHVWTQIPYALLAAAAEILAGDLLCGALGLPAWAGIIVGSTGLLVFVYIVGRRPEPVTAPG